MPQTFLYPATIWEQSLDKELNKVNEWFMVSFNISKTSYMIFGNKRKSDAQICFGMAKINQVDETKVDETKYHRI